MIWHIFRKDLRLLWPFALLAAVIHGLNAVFAYVAATAVALSIPSALLALASLVALVGLVISVGHQDPVPGARQDWLIRPIGRIDLVMAKLLFVVLVALAPLCAIDITSGWAHGLPFWDVVAASFRRGGALLCLICLPALLVAAITRTLMESVVAFALMLVAAMAFFGLLALSGGGGELLGTGVSWIIAASCAVLSLLAAVTVPPLQYLSRRTARSRWLTGVGLACALLVTLLPWEAGFAIQEKLSPQPGAGIGVEFQYAQAASIRMFGTSGGRMAMDPLHIHFFVEAPNLPRDTVLVSNHYYARILDRGGHILYQGVPKSNGPLLPSASLYLRRGEDSKPWLTSQQTIDIPPGVLSQWSGKEVQVEVDYSLTLYHSVARSVIAETSDRQLLPGLGSCVVRPAASDSPDGVVLHCVSTRPSGQCISRYVVQRDTGDETWGGGFCDHRQYAPFSAPIWRDAYFQLGWLGLGQRMPGEAAVADGHPVFNLIETLAPQDHFTRRVVIPQVIVTSTRTRGPV